MIIDLDMIKKFNSYYMFLNAFKGLVYFNKLQLKRSKNELEKQTNKL